MPEPDPPAAEDPARMGEDEQPTGEGPRSYTILRDLEGITKLTRKFLSSRHDYESVAAEIWLEAWNNGGRSPSPFVFATRRFIHRRCIDFLRRKIREEKANEESYRSKEAQLSFSSERLNVILSKSSLTFKEFEIVYRRFFHEQSVSEIATDMKLPEQKVKLILLLALEELKRVSRNMEKE